MATLVKSIRAPRDVRDLSFSPDDKLLAAGSKGHVTVWNYQAETVLDEAIRDKPGIDNANDPIRAPVTNEPQVRRVLFSPDSKVLAVACVDSDVRVYDLEQSKLLYSVYGNGRGGADCMAFSHDGKLLVTGGHDELLTLYDAAAGKLIRKLEGHLYNVVAVAFMADDKEIVSIGVQHLGLDNGEVRFWNSDTGELVDNRTIKLAPGIVTLSQDGRIIAGNSTVNNGNGIGEVIGEVSLWNTATGELVRKLGFPIYQAGLRFSPDNQVLMGWYQTQGWNFAYLWNVHSGEMYDIPIYRTTKPDVDNGPEPGACALSPNSKTFAFHLSNGVIQIWDISQFR